MILILYTPETHHPIVPIIKTNMMSRRTTPLDRRTEVAVLVGVEAIPVVVDFPAPSPSCTAMGLLHGIELIWAILNEVVQVPGTALLIVLHIVVNYRTVLHLHLRQTTRHHMVLRIALVVSSLQPWASKMRIQS